MALGALERGEEICEIYEAYLAYHPYTEIQLEEMMLLRRSLAKGDVVSIGRCRRCEGLILVDRLGQSSMMCWHCRAGSDAKDWQRGPHPTPSAPPIRP